MRTLKDWFERPTSTITYDYNQPQISTDLMDCTVKPPEPVPPPQTLYDLASYSTPFRWLFRRPRNVLGG